MVEQDLKEKIKKIYEVLPKLDDRSCGYRTCGEFAKAVAKREAPCYGCITGGYETAKKVCNIMGEKISDEEKVSSEYNNRAIDFAGGFGMGRGRGRGYRNRYYNNIIFPGESRYKSITPIRSQTEDGYNYHNSIYNNQKLDAEEERITLQQQTDFIRKKLDNIKKRISILEKDEKK